MKKQTFLKVILVITVVISAIFYFIQIKEERRIELIFEEAKRLNENSNLGLTFLEMSNEPGTTTKSNGNEQSDVGILEPDVCTEDGLVCGFYYTIEYPDFYSSHFKKDNTLPRYLTELNIERDADYHLLGVRSNDGLQMSTEYHVYGVKINDELQMSIDKLTALGYVVLEEEDYPNRISLEKDDIIIILRYDLSESDVEYINSISIRVEANLNLKDSLTQINY